MELSGARDLEMNREAWGCDSVQDAAADCSNAIVGGPFGSDLVSADYATAGVPVIRGQNMSGRFVSGEFVFVAPSKAKALTANLAYPGDLIFTQRGTLGQVALVPENGFARYVVSQSQMKVSLDRTRYEPAFVYYYFASEAGQKQITTSAIQTGVPHTNLGILRAYKFPAPPLPEQQAIAAALSDADALLDGLTRLIAKKRDLKQAAMQQLLTGRARLPEFGGEWEVKRLDQLGTWKGGMTPSMQNGAFWHNGDVPWISSGDVKFLRLSRTAAAITRAAVKAGASTMVPAGCVVLVVRSGILRKHLPVAMNEVPMAINQDIKALIPSSEISADFVLHTLIFHGDAILASCLKTGTTVESIDLRWLKAFTVRTPPTVIEQTAIATVLSDMDAELAALEARRAKTQALKQAMMQSLLTGRVRLVTLEPVHA